MIGGKLTGHYRYVWWLELDRWQTQKESEQAKLNNF